MANPVMSDQLPDRLSVDPEKPVLQCADVLARDIGVRFKGVEERQCRGSIAVSESWVRVPVGRRRIGTAIPSPSS